MGSIGNPTRVVRGGPRSGQTIAVTTPITCSSTSSSKAERSGRCWPASARHRRGLRGSSSISRKERSASRPVRNTTERSRGIYLDDDGPLGLEGWVDDIGPPPPRDELDLVESGAAHFVAVLRGEERPVLNAEHARHVLDIMLRA